jgi:hypothetical protein
MKKSDGTSRAREPERQKPEKRKPEKQTPDTQKPTDRPPAPWFQNRDKSANAMLWIPRQSKGAAFWENQSIKVNGGDVARPGVENEVSVVIRNLGAFSALNITVYFFWASPAFGLSNLNKIAVVDNLLINPGREIPVGCRWVPKAADGIHECLMVMCTALNDLQDWQNLQQWQPQIERRCAQHNVSVLPMKPGQAIKSSFEFANLLPMRAVTQLMGSVEQIRLPAHEPERTVSETLFSRVMQASVAAAPVRERSDPRLSQPTLSRSILLAPRVSLRAVLSESIGAIAAPNANRQLANLLTASDEMTRVSASPVAAAMSTLQEAVLHPFELRRVDFEVGAPEGAAPGDLFLYRFAQVAEGFLLGGYTVVVQVQR